MTIRIQEYRNLDGTLTAVGEIEEVESLDNWRTNLEEHGAESITQTGGRNYCTWIEVIVDDETTLTYRAEYPVPAPHNKHDVLIAENVDDYLVVGCGVDNGKGGATEGYDWYEEEKNGFGYRFSGRQDDGEFGAGYEDTMWLSNKDRDSMPYFHAVIDNTHTNNIFLISDDELAMRAYALLNDGSEDYISCNNVAKVEVLSELMTAAGITNY